MLEDGERDRVLQVYICISRYGQQYEGRERESGGEDDAAECRAHWKGRPAGFEYRYLS